MPGLDVKNFYREGLALSAAVHLGLLAFALFGLPHFSRPVPDIPDVVPVDFVEISDVTRSDDPAPEPEEKSPEPEPEQIFARDEPASQQLAEAVPLPSEKPEPTEIKTAPEPEPKPTPPEPRLEVAPRNKPKPPSRFDASKVAALIDRSIKEDKPKPVQTEAEPKEEPEEKRQQSALFDRIATATLQAAIRQKVQQCWYVPSGAKDLAEMRVKIRIQLRQDGSLLRPPQFLDNRSASASGNDFYRIFAESARRAVQNCEPYDNLPLAQYEKWRQIDFTFDAAEMAGG